MQLSAVLSFQERIIKQTIPSLYKLNENDNLIEQTLEKGDNKRGHHFTLIK